MIGQTYVGKQINSHDWLVNTNENCHKCIAGVSVMLVSQYLWELTSYAWT
jgi:hypothetical protein